VQQWLCDQESWMFATYDIITNEAPGHLTTGLWLKL